jgi:hypothetical protein
MISGNMNNQTVIKERFYLDKADPTHSMRRSP